MSSMLISILTVVMLGLVSVTGYAAPIAIMYGGLGGHTNGDSTNDGALAIVDQATGAVTILGHPAGVSRISGLVFDTTGALFGATQGPGGFPPPPGPLTASDLIRLNPATGALLSSVLIRDALGNALSIADLAVQPGTNTLFGVEGPIDRLNRQGTLYTINTTTGVATLVGNTGHFFASIAFAPDGTLYLSSADMGPMGQDINVRLSTLNPSNAATLSFVPTEDFFGALGVRPTDGAIFGGTGDAHQLFRINPATGAETLVGDTGLNFVGDLAFVSVPEPATLALLGVGLAGLGFSRRRKSN
jgi:PEP-CTERM motif